MAKSPPSPPPAPNPAERAFRFLLKGFCVIVFAPLYNMPVLLPSSLLSGLAAHAVSGATASRVWPAVTLLLAFCLATPLCWAFLRRIRAKILRMRGRWRRPAYVFFSVYVGACYALPGFLAARKFLPGSLWGQFVVAGASCLIGLLFYYKKIYNNTLSFRSGLFSPKTNSNEEK